MKSLATSLILSLSMTLLTGTVYAEGGGGGGRLGGGGGGRAGGGAVGRVLSNVGGNRGGSAKPQGAMQQAGQMNNVKAGSQGAPQHPFLAGQVTQPQPNNQNSNRPPMLGGSGNGSVKPSLGNDPLVGKPPIDASKPLSPGMPPTTPSNTPAATPPSAPPQNSPGDKDHDHYHHGGFALPLFVPVSGGQGGTTVVLTTPGYPVTQAPQAPAVPPAPQPTQTSASAPVDLELLDVRQIDGGKNGSGPAFRVTFRNSSGNDLAEQFEVALAASLSRQLNANLPMASVPVPGLRAQETQSVDVRLPVEALQMGSNLTGGHIPFAWLTAAVDARGLVTQTSRDNDAVMINRNDIPMVELTASAR